MTTLVKYCAKTFNQAPVLGVPHALTNNALTHWGRVTHICISHYLNQWWNIDNFNRNSNILIEENVIESVVCEMAAILSRSRCGKQTMFEGGREVKNPSDSLLLVVRLLMENRLFSCGKLMAKASVKWKHFYIFWGMSEWVIKFNGLSGDSGQRGPYSPYKPCNHSLYIGIIIFPHLTHNLQATIYFKKKDIKKDTKKVRAPIKLTCHWRWQLYISLQLF